MSLAPDEPDLDPELLVPGTEVGEHVVGELIGKGGFARVYRAQHPVLGTEVAVKVITRALALDTEASQRFIREAQAASRIVHPNVVRVVGFGRLADGRAYQAMELVKGRSLAEYLEQSGPLPLHEALAILTAVANALDAAHAAGIVHRDVKPANVLVEGAGPTLRVRLSDFGVAKALEMEDAPNLTTTGVTLGTPRYMSPEQALGRKISFASDVYSFGVLAFELLTGRLPFDAESAFATMMMHVQTEPPLASQLCPEIGTGFDAPLQAMLAKHPEDRPATIAAALASLSAPLPSPRPVRRARRSAHLWLGAGVLVASAVVVIATRAPEPVLLAPLVAPHVTYEPPPAPVVEATRTSAPVVTEAPPESPPRPPVDAPSGRPSTKPRATVPSTTKPAIPPADDLELPPDYQL